MKAWSFEEPQGKTAPRSKEKQKAKAEEDAARGKKSPSASDAGRKQELERLMHDMRSEIESMRTDMEKLRAELEAKEQR